MRDLFKLFDRRYSAVNSNDSNAQNVTNNNTTEENLQYLQQIDFNQRQRKKSLQPSRSLKQGFTIVDSFFNQRKGGKRYPKCAFLLLAAGLCAIGSAIAIFIIQPYDAIFKWKLVFGEGGEIFTLWKNPPVDIYIKIYLWNITNSEAFLAGEEKMHLEEVGPYVYRELLSHGDVVFNDNGTVSTIPKHPLIWDEERSMGNKEDDLFILPNIALLSIAQVASEKSYFLRLPINLVIRQTNSQPIVNVTAREFMFGYESPLTTLGNQFLPDWIYFDKVGLIDRMYDFVGDYATFYTGESDPSVSGLYDTYMGSRHLKQWDDDHCNNINGASDGTKFRSFIKPTDELLFFRKSMCRPQRLIRVGNATVKSELEAYKYQFEDNAMDNGFTDERNKCFCRDGNCLPAGLLDISECYYGFPIALSYPHFMDTDSTVAEHVVGLTPNRSKHETYFYVQPTSGLPLELSVKFQINMAMRDVSNMAHVQQFSNIVIPMLWFEITLEKLPDALRNRFNLYLNVLPIVVDASQYGLLVIGTMMLLYAVTRVSMKLSNSMQPSHKVSKSRKYSSIYPDMIQRFGDVEKVFELNEKSRKNSISRADLLYDVDLSSEKKFMLDEEPAISEDEGTDSDSKSNSDIGSFKNSEIVSLKTNSTDTTMPFEGWTMGATSSCINDIANDDFAHILHIEEVKNNGNNSETDTDTDEDDSDNKCDYERDMNPNEKMPMLKTRKAPILQIPQIRTSASNNNILDLESSSTAASSAHGESSFLSVPGMGASSSTTNISEMKSSGSDVSISFFLDRDDAGEEYDDENTFANVNSNTLLEPTRKKSNVNVTFLLDDQD